MTKCPYCGEKVDKNSFDCIKNTIQGLNTRSYYHLKCHVLAQETPKDKWPFKIQKAEKKQSENDLYAELIYDYLLRERRILPDMRKIKSQMTNFTKKGMKPKGMYLSIRFFYEVKKTSQEDESNGGIGIVPYVYEEAGQYWLSQKQKQEDVLAAIDKQIEEKKNREVVRVIKKNNTRKKDKYNLDEI